MIWIYKYFKNLIRNLCHKFLDIYFDMTKINSFIKAFPHRHNQIQYNLWKNLHKNHNLISYKGTFIVPRKLSIRRFGDVCYKLIDNNLHAKVMNSFCYEDNIKQIVHLMYCERNSYDECIKKIF